MRRISVLLPAYNGIAYIEEAVQSVLAQDLTDWELLISDDGSKDETRKYLRHLDDPRIKVFEQPANLGIFGNLNFLLQQANAPIAKILGQDDRLLPHCLRRISMFMETRPWCAVSRCWQQGHQEWTTLRYRHQLVNALPQDLAPDATRLAFATFGNIVGNLCRATCRPAMVLEAGGFDQSFPYAGDYEGWYRIGSKHGIALQNEELVFQRRHSEQNSILLNRKNELFPQLNRLIEKMAGDFPDEELQLLRRNWIANFLTQRVSRFFRQVAKGEFNLARGVFSDLPLGISSISVLAAYPAFKADVFDARRLPEHLYSRIVELNLAAPKNKGPA